MRWDWQMSAAVIVTPSFSVHRLAIASSVSADSLSNGTLWKRSEFLLPYCSSCSRPQSRLIQWLFRSTTLSSSSRTRSFRSSFSLVRDEIVWSALVTRPVSSVTCSCRGLTASWTAVRTVSLMLDIKLADSSGVRSGTRDVARAVLKAGLFSKWSIALVRSILPPGPVWRLIP